MLRSVCWRTQLNCCWGKLATLRQHCRDLSCRHWTHLYCDPNGMTFIPFKFLER